jgi:trk system potassium uptake protein TrkA
LSAELKYPQLHDSVAVIGLRRFGSAVAESLMHLGHEVLGIDEDAGRVQFWSDRLTRVAQADSTNVQALRQLGLSDLAHAIVGIGGNIEANVLTVLALQEVGVKDIWARAISDKHETILKRLGVQNVINLEATMGERVAHLVTGKMIDFIEFDDGFAIVKTRAPKEDIGKTLAQSALRSKYGVTIVGVKSPKADFTYAKPETSVNSGDLLIVAGETRAVERFASTT